MAIREPRSRVYIGDKPPEVARVEQNPTKHIRAIELERKSTAPPSEFWFSGRVPLNAGLVAIIGNKGSGKSALADIIGLLGSSKNALDFPFLNDKRFRHHKSGLAAHFCAKLEWQSGEIVEKDLDQDVAPSEVERVKYLPQDHVEKVCNELEGTDEHGFETELKNVIFSHVPEELKLEQSSLDDLVNFKTGEKQRRIDSLIKELRQLSRERANLEIQSAPEFHAELLEKLKRREIELEAHDKVRPMEPAIQPEDSLSPETTAALQALENARIDFEKKISSLQVERGRIERKAAVASRLLERLVNFTKEFTAFTQSLNADANELGIKVTDLVGITVNDQLIKDLVTAAKNEGVAVTAQLDPTSPKSVAQELESIRKQIQSAKDKLDVPNREFQTYITSLESWTKKRDEIFGSLNEPESVSSLRARLDSLSELPKKIDEFRVRQLKIAAEIHSEKLEQAEVYRTLYEPVQRFIDEHPLARDKLKLEFRAELANIDFTKSFLALISQNRKGSFMGLDEGNARSELLVREAQWDSPSSTQDFVTQVDRALHFDLREGANESPTQLKDQLPRGKRVEEVFDMLYGLEYLQPRYVLKWEGKDLSVLSPGERGTLLLVFYLLIDKSDVPLLIDQPEGNLDNHTVAKVLVDCIREARRRRQVFLVTHNPNLAVVCDADQIVHANMDKRNGNLVTYSAGALEDPSMTVFMTDVLEGTRQAFNIRDSKYWVGEFTSV